MRKREREREKCRRGRRGQSIKHKTNVLTGSRVRGKRRGKK